MAGESGSEAIGQQAGYGEIDPTDVALEGLLAVVQGGAMAAGEKTVGKALGSGNRGETGAAIERAQGVISAMAQAQAAPAGGT